MGEYVDNDVSATRRKPRPEYDRLLADVEAGAVDAIVAWDLDRLTRRPRDLENIFDLGDRSGLRQLATVGGDIDLAAGHGVLVARIKGAVAAEEARKIGERVARKKRELAEAGRPPGGGLRPFGFMPNGIDHHPTEARMLREVGERSVAGSSYAREVKRLTEEGITSTTGQALTVGTLRRTLTNPRMAGLRT